MRRPRLPRPRLGRPRLPRPRLRRASRPGSGLEAPGPPPEGGPLAALQRRLRSIGEAAAPRLRSVGYAAQDFAYLVGRVPRALARAARGFWMGLSLRTRQRLALALLGGLVATLVLAFTIPRLPCQFPGGDVCPPADDAELIVPADALGYVHVNLDPDSDQYERAAEISGRIPGISRQLAGRLLAQVPGPGGEPADFAGDIAPWLGEQAAVAIVPVGDAGEQVQLLEAGDPTGAAEFAASLAAGSPATADYRGIEISTDSRGLATASVGGFLAIGTEAGIKRLVDVATEAEGTRPLADDPLAAELRDELPPERFAEAYLSLDGIERLVADQSSPLSSLEPFVDATASEGVAASLGAGDGTLEVTVRSSLDPERARTSPGFFAAFPPFEPELPELLADDTLAYVGIADPGTTVSELLAQATAEAPALAQGFAAAAERLRDLGEVDVEEELLPALGGEAAFSLAPGSEPAPPSPSERTTTAPPAVPEGLPGGPAPTPPGEPAVPVLSFLADGVDSERAREGLARLQGPIAEALDPASSLQAPVFDRREIDGVEAQVVRISPTVNLTYALAGDRLVVATQPEGVERAISGEGGLSGTERFGEATGGLPEELSLLAYLDLGGLLGLAEREGLGEDPIYAALAPEIRRLEALSLGVEAKPDALGTELRLVIGDDSAGAEAESEEPAE